MEAISQVLMPLDKVAQALGVSIYSVRRYVANGSLSAVRIGARVMVSNETVERAQREGVRQPARTTPKTSRRKGR